MPKRVERSSTSAATTASKAADWIGRKSSVNDALIDKTLPVKSRTSVGATATSMPRARPNCAERATAPLRRKHTAGPQTLESAVGFFQRESRARLTLNELQVLRS